MSSLRGREDSVLELSPKIGRSRGGRRPARKRIGLTPRQGKVTQRGKIGKQGEIGDVDGLVHGG